MAGGIDLEPGVGMGPWLYRQDGMVLGPLPARALLEKLYAGQVSPQTEVALPGERTWRKLADVEAFRVHVARAEAKARVDAQAALDRTAARKRHTRLFGALGAVTLVLAAGAVWVARYLAVHGAVPEESAGLVDVEMEPPVIALARARGADEELVDYPLGGVVSASRGGGGPAADRPGAVAGAQTDRRRGSASGTPRTGLSGARVETDADGLSTEVHYDESEMQGVLQAQKRTLNACFLQQKEREPNFGGRIALEFVVGNNGRVAKLWVDHPSYKTGPLYDCLLDEMQKWPFRPYQGAQASLATAFRIAKKE